MPSGILPRPSLILGDYLKSFDCRERSGSFPGRVDAKVVDRIVDNLLDLLDPVP